MFIQIVLGFTVGVFAGMLGVGGGILMIPALLYVYPSLVSPYDALSAQISMKTATGIAAFSSLCGSFSASITHYLHKNANLRLMLFIAIGTMTGSYLGSYTSGFYSNTALKVVYAVVLLFIIIRYLREPHSKPESIDTPAEFVLPDFTANRPLVFKIWGIAFLIGYIAGLLGIGGAIMLIPLMIYYLKVPVRLAIGSTSGIVFLSAITMFAGKWQAGLIPFPHAVTLAVSAIPGGIVGAMWSKRLSERFLQGFLMLLIALTLVRLGFELLG